MDKKLKIKTDGTSKIDLNQIDLAAQARMFSGGVDSHPIEAVLTKEMFEQTLRKISRPPTKADEEKL